MGNICNPPVIERSDVIRIIQETTIIPKTLSSIIDSYLIPENVYNAPIMKYTSEDDIILTYKRLQSMMLKVESGILLYTIAPWIYESSNNKEKRKITLILEHMGMDFKFKKKNILILYNLIRNNPVRYRRIGTHGEYYSYIDYLAPLPQERYIPGFYKYISNQI